MAPPFVVNCNYTVLQQFWLPWIRQPTEKTVCNLWFPKIIDICDKLYSFSKSGMKSDVKCKMFWNKTTFCSHLLFWGCCSCGPPDCGHMSHVIMSWDFQDTVRELVQLSSSGSRTMLSQLDTHVIMRWDFQDTIREFAMLSSSGSRTYNLDRSVHFILKYL